MSDDLIGRLRKAAIEPCDGCCYGETMIEAADALKRLTAENRALRTRYEGKPTEPGGKGFCRGACEYRELTAENKTLREALTQCERRD